MPGAVLRRAVRRQFVSARGLGGLKWSMRWGFDCEWAPEACCSIEQVPFWFKFLWEVPGQSGVLVTVCVSIASKLKLKI
ncbi:hypothetical protein GOP47_0022564 [Adiantum capillus-veneris]|uniref:Uncharacterized protein n=1 Tax=Adiantum capillus-veneris TaxID=13818 RepID=A0A9D4U6J0_ADICA|nr:hypothetical protein GOP47_0022564 [Adiantum capillus-veneris]